MDYSAKIVTLCLFICGWGNQDSQLSVALDTVPSPNPGNQFFCCQIRFFFFLHLPFLSIKQEYE